MGDDHAHVTSIVSPAIDGLSIDFFLRRSCPKWTTNSEQPYFVLSRRPYLPRFPPHPTETRPRGHTPITRRPPGVTSNRAAYPGRLWLSLRAVLTTGTHSTRLAAADCLLHYATAALPLPP